MRGPDHQQSTMFSYLSPEQRVPADHPLRAVRQMADTILAQLPQLFSKMYSDIGRRSIPPEELLRVFDYEGNRQDSATTKTVSVPTLKEKVGDYGRQEWSHHAQAPGLWAHRKRTCRSHPALL